MCKESAKKIIVDIGNGLKLVAEQNNDPVYKNEIYIGVMKEDGVWYQDLAVVRNAYSFVNGGELFWKDGVFDVIVYADKDSEDFTDVFSIEVYHGGI